MTNQINCSVTVMPIYRDRIGFIQRGCDDSFPNLFIAPGGKVEESDGVLMGGVPYYSVEQAAIREVKEETGIDISKNQLHYFCSLTLPNGRVVISFYCKVSLKQLQSGIGGLLLFTKDDIIQMDKFAPGMKEEALMLFKELANK